MLMDLVFDLTGVRSVPVQVANELVEAGHKYVDVRTPEEFENGHPEGAINVPYMLKHGGGNCPWNIMFELCICL
jgi:hypothetical protein